MSPANLLRSAESGDGPNPDPGRGNLFVRADGELRGVRRRRRWRLLPRPSLYRAGATAALVSLVPRDDYSGAAAVHLADPAWLSPRILYHGGLLRQAMQLAPIYPAPFGTLYSSAARLTAFMRTHEETVLRFLHDVAGQEEWGLRATAQLGSPAALEDQARESWADWARLTPGTRYLRLCRERPALMAAGRAAAERAIAALVEQLRTPASSIRQLASQPTSSGGSELTVRFALLVPVDAAALLARRVREIADTAAAREVTLSLSGPWPAFSFRPALSGP